MNIKNTIILFALLFVNTSILNAQQQVSETTTTRPKVGLVMSGGGAKGFAYIGILKVLEEVNMPVDYVGGSSMGAITAALYSVGYSAETIKEIIRDQNWDALISDKQERQYISYEEKLFGDKYIYTMPIHDKVFSLSQSINSSFNIDLILNRLFASAAHITDFNDLPVPFLCIGVDLLTGEPVVLREGNVARAVRASMAIPGYFPPTKYDGKYLIDGGVINNYPAEQVKAMGADIIIGADTQTGLKKNIEDIGSMTAVLDQVIGFNRVEANKKGYEITDYHIKIGMPYEMLDFDMFDSIIAVGERVAREHYTELKALADSLNSLDMAVSKRTYLVPVDSVQVNKVLWSEMSLKHGDKYHLGFQEMNKQKVALSDLENKMLLLNGTRNFNELRYEFIPGDGEGLNVEIEASDVNKGSLAVGLHYDQTYSGSILLNLTYRNLKGGRSKIFTDFVLGQNPRLKSMFIINNGLKPGFGMEADFYSLDFSQYQSGEKINQWDFDSYSFSAFMPMTFRNDFMFKLGMEYELFRFKQEVVVDSTFAAYDNFESYGNLFATFNYDSRNKAHFATKGQLLELKLQHVFPFSDQWDDLLSNGTIITGRYNAYLRITDKLVYQPELFLGYTYSDEISDDGSDSGQKFATVQHMFAFGGTNPNNYVDSHISFTGLKYMERFGLFAGKLSTNFEYNFYPKLYASLLADIGAMEDRIMDVEDAEFLLGYGAKLSYSSAVGPIDLVFSSSNVDTSLNVFFNLGFWF